MKKGIKLETQTMDSPGKHFNEERLDTISRCSKAVVDMEKKGLQEIKSFSKPPVGVKDVLTGTMMLLGDTGADLEWRNIKKSIGNIESFRNRVGTLDVESIPTETREKARTVLDKYTADGIMKVSKATHTVYEWAVAVSDE